MALDYLQRQYASYYHCKGAMVEHVCFSLLLVGFLKAAVGHLWKQAAELGGLLARSSKAFLYILLQYMDTSGTN